MTAYTIRQVPWTCEWGRFGVATRDLERAGVQVDDVFWACHRPARELRVTRRGECERCPFWKESDHGF